jgi:hypothetical protein
MVQRQVMTQTTQTAQATRQQRLVRPKRFDIFLHLPKTVRLLGALIADRRIPLSQKILFFSIILLLLVALLFPDLLNEAFLTTLLPVLGTLIGVPVDAGVDWIAFAMIVVNLMHIFPAAIVSEHYQRIFR